MALYDLMPIFRAALISVRQSSSDRIFNPVDLGCELHYMPVILQDPNKVVVIMGYALRSFNFPATQSYH